MSKDIDLERLNTPVPEEERPTIPIAASITAADKNDAVHFIENVPVERIPHFILRFREVAAKARALADALEVRWGLDAGGLSWNDPDSGDWYDYKSEARGEFKDIPDLVAGLVLDEGVAVPVLARAITGLRVTDLRAIADDSVDKERGKRMREMIDDHRTFKSGPRHLTRRDEEKQR